MFTIGRNLSIILLCLLSVATRGQVTANFTASPTIGCAPLVVNFTNTSTGATSYQWNLGNGTYTSLTNPGGTYTNPGTYTVTLTAVNGTETSTKTLTITVNPSPVVNFTVNDTSICPGATAAFTDQSNLNVPGAGTYSWFFGDGGAANSQNPTHPYTAPGYFNVTLTVTNSQGCIGTLTKNSYMHVLNPPTAAFNANPTYFCAAPANVTFNNTSVSTGTTSYNWSFGDNTNSTQQNPTHSYGTIGTYYSVKLIVTDGNGCKDSLTRTNYIHIGNLQASFTGPSSACIYQNVTFTNTTTQPNVNSTWYFGDGSSSTAANGSHGYINAGTYTVKLVVTDGTCSDSITHNITINPEPTASFTFSPLQPCPAPAPIQFTSTAPAGSTFSWDFGDGTGGSTQANPIHTYLNNEIDTARMVVTNTNGCKDTVKAPVSIYDLHLHLIADTAMGCVPRIVHFSSFASTNVPYPATPPFPYPYPIVSYSWTFGDGPTIVTTPTPTHTYTAFGTYTAQVTVTFANGCTATDTAIIHVGVPATLTGNDTPTHVCLRDRVTFYGHASGTGPLYYIWVFGDGGRQGGQYDSVDYYKYPIPGTFHPYFEVLNNGCLDSIPLNTVIVDSPKSKFAFNFSCDTPALIKFTNQSLGATSYVWVYGDGNTSTQMNPHYLYPAIDTYSMYLATYNANSGCRDTAMADIPLVKLRPNIVADDTAICRGDSVHFTLQISGGTPLQEYYYSNGVLIDTNKVYFAHRFTDTGHLTIEVRVIDAHLCQADSIRPYYITVAHPFDTFAAVPPSGCAPFNANFTDLTKDISGVGIKTRQWIFGDGGGTTVTSSTVSHLYAAGSYTVKEIVTDSLGCKDSVSYTNYITAAKPHASFGAINTYPCRGVPTTFVNNSTGGVVSSKWYFGDGDSSLSMSPNHAYLNDGSYTVTLIVTSAAGCVDTMKQINFITVAHPHAAFTMDDSSSVCPPLSVHFTNASTGAVGYYWDFGNINTSYFTNPSNLYTATGNYTVMMVATDVHGCPDTVYHNVSLYGYAGSFTYTPLIGCNPLTVSFTANVSNVSGITWDFTDGNVVATGTATTITHTYTTPGTYIPRVVLSDNTGCQASSLGVDTIKVEGITPGFSVYPVPCMHDTVSFVDTSKGLFSPVISWQWVFDNGVTGSSDTVKNYYDTAGIYAVSLVVGDALGCKDTMNGHVQIFPLPVIETMKDTIICVSDGVTLTADGGVSYVWTPTATLSCSNCDAPLASPTAETVYYVTGTDGNGCASDDSVHIGLKTKTTAVAGGGGEICAGDSILVTASGAQAYSWLPPESVSNSHAGYTMVTPQYSTTYMVISKSGSCEADTDRVTVIVHPLPTVNAGGDQTIVEGNSTTLETISTNVDKYAWSPTDGLGCDSCSNPSAKPAGKTTYTVNVYSDFGCRAADSVTINVLCDKSQVFIPNSFTPNGDGQNDLFYPRGVGISNIKSFRVYNRWGEVVFERLNINVNDESNAWDGTIKGEPAKPDVYVYVMDAICEAGTPVTWKGDVTIIK